MTEIELLKQFVDNENFDLLDRDEKNLIMYLETCMVDHYGRIETRRMNEVDWVNMEKFKRIDLIKYGRLSSKYINSCIGEPTRPTHWVRFTLQAWKLAHLLRTVRGEKLVGSEEAQRGITIEE